MSIERSGVMNERMPEGVEQTQSELHLKGLIYVRALRAAGGASREELLRFSEEIRRERRRLESSGVQIGHGFAEAARPAAPPGTTHLHAVREPGFRSCIDG